MKKVLFLCLILSGCVSNRVLYIDQEKNIPVYEVQCNAYRHTFGDCLQKANEVCPKGIEIISSQNEIAGSYFGFNGNTNVNYYNGWGGVSNDYKRNLIYTCKPN